MAAEGGHKARVLYALGMGGVAIVLATDSVWVAHEVESISPNADYLGLLLPSGYAEDPGIYLWEGILSTYVYNNEPETDYEGSYRPVKPEELAELLDMAPPPLPTQTEDGD